MVLVQEGLAGLGNNKHNIEKGPSDIEEPFYDLCRG
jgi:hypothetical protein